MIMKLINLCFYAGGLLYLIVELCNRNSTYTPAGVSRFVGQKSAKFKVQFFVGSSVVKIPACV